MKKGLFAVGASLALAFGLASCSDEKDPNQNPGGGEGKTIELVYSGTASNKDFNMTLFEDFKKSREDAGDPNTYNITYVEHGPDKVDSEIQDWSIGPDVYEFASDKITGLYQKGALAKLTATQSKWVKDNNNDLGYDLATFNGSVYAYPYTGDNTYYLQYDKSKLTTEDVKSIERILEVANEENLKLGYNIKEAFWGGAMMFTFGADFSMTFDEDGNVKTVDATFDSEEGQKAVKAIEKIMSDPAWTNEMAAPTKDNNFIGCIAGTWDIAAYREALGDNYGCAPMPTVTIDGDTKNLGAFLGGKLLGVNPLKSGNDTDRLAAAHLLAQFLSNEESQLKRFDEQNVAPCNINASKAERVVSDENVKVLIEQAKFAHAQTAVPGDFWTAPATMTTAIEEAIKAGQAVDYAQLVATFNASVEASK